MPDSTAMGDRTQFIPSHEGENVLPNMPFFHRLLRYAQRSSSRIAIRDLNAGLEKTYHHLLSDVLAVRKVLKGRLSTQVRRDLAADKEVYIGLLAPGGYEYTVGFMAILALGAAVVPMGKSSKRKGKRAKLISISCCATGRRSILLPSKSSLRRSTRQYNQRTNRRISPAICIKKQRYTHPLHITNCIILPKRTPFSR
jgi:acyl-CoA synthetase (AMP-forming)/AMP-acid ligase II